MRLYEKRNAATLEPYYTRHVAAMTAEGLHDKGDIAAELAYRDQQIEKVTASLEASLQVTINDTVALNRKLMEIRQESGELLDVLQKLKAVLKKAWNERRMPHNVVPFELLRAMYAAIDKAEVSSTYASDGSGGVPRHEI
jgi:phage shock protein A